MLYFTCFFLDHVPIIVNYIKPFQCFCKFDVLLYKESMLLDWKISWSAATITAVQKMSFLWSKCTRLLINCVVFNFCIWYWAQKTFHTVFDYIFTAQNILYISLWHTVVKSDFSCCLRFRMKPLSWPSSLCSDTFCLAERRGCLKLSLFLVAFLLLEQKAAACFMLGSLRVQYALLNDRAVVMYGH